MISHIFSHKLNAIIVFLSSFGFGAFFLDNYKIIGNFLGAIISTILIELIKNYFKNKKNGSK